MQGSSTTAIDKAKGLLLWRVFLGLAALQAFMALGLIFQERSESAAAFLFGLSRIRFAIVLGILLILLAFAWGLVESWIRPERVYRRIQFLAQHPRLSGILILLCGLVFLTGVYFITLLPEIEEPFTTGYFKRLLPLAVLFTGLSAQTLVALLFVRYGPGLWKRSPRNRPFFICMTSFGVIFLAWAWVSRTLLPTESRIIGWNSLGVPILETQVLLAWAAGMVMLILTLGVFSKADRASRPSLFAPQRLDWLVGFLIWLGAVLLWQSIPLVPSWFVSELRTPNSEHYPNSDAFRYDASAQTAMVGEGFTFFDLPFVRRPGLGLVFTLFHLIAGQKYESVVFLQILALALIPVLVYFLTRTLHNRVSGVIAAALIILREANSITITDRITTSNVKLLMADLPTLMAVLGLTLITIAWLQQIEKRKFPALLVGGLLGFSMLIRFETLIFVLPLGLLAAGSLFPKRQYASWLKNMLLVLVGITLVISPWIWRNWKLSGLIFIDSPTSRFDLIAQRFSPVSTAAPAPSAGPPEEAPPEEFPPTALPQVELTQAPPATLPATQPATPAAAGAPTPQLPAHKTFIEQVSMQALEFIRSNPSLVIRSILAHYLNSQVQTFLSLPTSVRTLDSLVSSLGHRSPERFWYECCSTLSYIRRLPYWHKWDGYFPGQAILPLLLNLLVIAVGVDEAWKRRRWIGLAPLVFSLTYLFLNALFRNSGGRYILPVDWVSIVYFSIGLARLSVKAVELVKNSPVAELVNGYPLDTAQAQPMAPAAPERLWRSDMFYATLLGFLLLGCSLPLAERAFPPLYTEEKKAQMSGAVLGSELLNDAQRQGLQTFLSNGGGTLAGRALYPRYFPPGLDEVGSHDLLGPRQYSRVAFYLAGPVSSNLYMLIQNKIPFFPNASDVLVFLCPEREIIAIAIFDPAGEFSTLLTRSPLPPAIACPIPLPEK